MLDGGQRAVLAGRLDTARCERRPTALPRAEYPNLTLADGYAVQHDWTARRASPAKADEPSVTRWR
jgi:2-keto-4-pentenoate hydratase